MKRPQQARKTSVSPATFAICRTYDPLNSLESAIAMHGHHIDLPHSTIVTLTNSGGKVVNAVQVDVTNSDCGITQRLSGLEC